MESGTVDCRWRRAPLGIARVSACAAILLALGIGAAKADDPRPADEETRKPLCCGVPPPGEVTADQVFGRWVVTKSGIGAPLRPGERVEFRADGTLNTSRGPCRFAVLRAELTVTCADKAQSGELRFVDDTKLIWRHDGRETLFVAPTD